MRPGIYLKKIWFDDDLIELEIKTITGNSVFSNRVYTSNPGISKLIVDLSIFRNHIYGGIYDINIGGFGPEYANGAFHARLHFDQSGKGKLYMTIKAQSEFYDFGRKNIANEAILHLISEPILLDNFITELKALESGAAGEAKFEGIGLWDSNKP